MKIKKSLAWLLVGVLTVPLLPTTVYANAQKAVQVVTIDEGEVGHKLAVQGRTDIVPSVKVQWEAPDDNTMGATGDSKVDKQRPEYYQFRVIEHQASNTGYLSELIRTNAGDQAKMIYNANLNAYNYGYDSTGTNRTTEYALKNGTLYRVEVIPRHRHQVGENITIAGPDSSTSSGFDYVLTDFNTTIENRKGELVISWEYVPGAIYDVRYVNKERHTKSELNRTDGRVVLSLTNADVVRNGNRVEYTIPNTLPGVIYSAYAEVTSIDGVNFDLVKRNKKEDAAGPKVSNGTTSMQLNLETIVGDDIRLWWEMPPWVGTGNYLLEKVYIYEKGNPAYIGTVEVADVTSYALTAPPDVATTYYAVFIFKKDGEEIRLELQSNEVTHTPFKLRIQPLKPVIPKPYGDNLKEDPTVSAKDFLVTRDDKTFATPGFKDSTFHFQLAPSQRIQLTWDVPYNQLEPLGAQTLDYSLFYDIWVSEDTRDFADDKFAPVLSNISISESSGSNLIYTTQTKEVVGFKYFINQYRDSTGLLRNIQANKTYYIKMVAKRSYGTLASGATDYEASQPTVVAITIDKNGDIFTPPVIAKPPLQLEDVTQTSVTVKWTEEWYEILAKSLEPYNSATEVEKLLARNGSAKVYTGGTPAIRYIYGEEWVEHILLTRAHVDAVIRAVGEAAYRENYYDRKVTLGKDVGYEMKVLPYDEIEGQLGVGESIEQWIYTHERTMSDGSTNLEGWATISPSSKSEGGLDWRLATQENLKPNTRYVVMLRAYRTLEDGTVQRQDFPSYVIATTLTDREDPDPDPTVPVLHLEEKSDTSITVWWKYNKDFTYELVYSRKDDPNTATVWPFQLDEKLQDGSRAIVKIAGLFPETSYNIWVRAVPKQDTAQKKWSNPVTAKTDPLQAPTPPTGLGPAAYQSLLDINQDFPPIGKDYITVEWVKNENDLGTQEENGIVRSYDYILEFADNVEFLDAITVEVKDDNIGSGNEQYTILAKNIVRFNRLIANRPYYVRVKTRVNLVGSESDLALSKESSFTAWIRILTKTSDGEYDGGENDNIVIYPDKIIETYEKDIWTMEVVDTQSVISDLLNSKAYYLTFKMEKYRDRIDAGTRVVKLPKALVDAVIGQRMEIRIETLKGIYQIPGSTLKSYTEKGNAKDIVSFELTTILAYDISNIIKPLPHELVAAEQLRITMNGQRNWPALTKLDGEMRVRMKLDQKNMYQTNNLSAYTYTIGSWVQEGYSIENKEEGTYVSFPTPRVGIFGLYKLNKYTGVVQTSSSINDLLGRYNIPALRTTYGANDKVHSNQYISMLVGLAQNQATIDITGTPSVDKKQQAKSSGLYVSSASGNITQEQAIAGIVKLYELKWGQRIAPATSRNVANVSATYREAVQKAYAIGLISSIQPSSTVTYNQLCSWLNLILP